MRRGVDRFEGSRCESDDSLRPEIRRICLSQPRRRWPPGFFEFAYVLLGAASRNRQIIRFTTRGVCWALDNYSRKVRLSI